MAFLLKLIYGDKRETKKYFSKFLYYPSFKKNL